MVSLMCTLGRRWVGKDVRFGSEARAVVLAGVDKLADAVAATLGPKGRNVIIEESGGKARVTKDGATVAAVVRLEGRLENLGARLLHDVATAANENAGDGTSTATILARELAKEGSKCVVKGANPIEIRKGVMLAVEKVVGKLKAMSRPVGESEEAMEKVARVSANGDASIGALIARAIKKVGKEGVVTVKDGNTLYDELEIVEGFKFQEGLISHFFVNTSKGAKAVFEEPFLMLSTNCLRDHKEVVPAMEAAHLKRRPLVVIAEDVTDEALSSLVVNRLRIGLQVAAVKAPGYGQTKDDILKDMAVATGATLFGEEGSNRTEKSLKESDLGSAKEVTITKEDTLILGGRGSRAAVGERAAYLRDLVDETTNDYERYRLKERLASLASGVAVITVGGSNEADIGEKKDRIQDALNATKAALQEGVVPGGGTALVRALEALQGLKTDNKDQATGVEIVAKALRTPCMTIAKNAGEEDPSVVFNKVRECSGDVGYDAMTGTYVNLVEKGILDPTKVVRLALEDAAGLASLLTTVEAFVTDLPAKQEKPLVV